VIHNGHKTTLPIAKMALDGISHTMHLYPNIEVEMFLEQVNMPPSH
jgi:hypothetical protein